MTFREFKDQVMNAHHFNEEYFAESVTFYPASGGSSGGSRRITVHLVEDSQWQVNGSNYDSLEEITVLAWRDPDTGIDSQDIGDQILRDPENDPIEVPYTFQEVHESQRPGKTRLKYTRARQKVAGATRRS